MSKLSFIVEFLAVGFLMTACLEEELIPSEPLKDEEVGTLDFAVDAQTRASCSGLKISFQEGDQISVNGVSHTVENVGGVLMLRDVACSKDNQYACVFPAAGDFLGTSDSNYKWPNVQFYQKESFGRNAMPLICHARIDPSESTPTLSFAPAMGVLVLPVSASGVNIRSIKVEDNNFNPQNGLTYMSGRMLPYDSEGKSSSSITADSRYFEISHASSTAECPNVVLLCNDAEGKGIGVSGKRNFYVVVPPRDYFNGIKVTITDNSHRSQVFRTTGQTKVAPGEKITMKTLMYKPSDDQYFSENFDPMVYGSDPVGMRAGVVGYRGYLVRRSENSQSGLFSDTSVSGLESNVYYGNVVNTTDSGSASIKESTPGSDIYANWHTNATNDKDDVYSMSDIDTGVMSESYIRTRGMWDWCPSRIIEYQGYILVGKSQSVTNAYSGMTATGSPQGALKTPALTNIATIDNVKLSFKIAKGFGSGTQKIRITCQGSGSFLTFDCEGLATSISADGRYAYIENASSLSAEKWTVASLLVGGATSATHFQFMAPDGTAKEKTTTFYLDDILVEKADVKKYANLTGCVTCEGVPMAGVVISDGYSVTKTDSEGKYYIAPANNSKFVFISVPSGYEAQRSDGDIRSKYFQSIDPQAQNVVDFQLHKVDQGSYTLFVMADSHVLGGTSRYTASNDAALYRSKFIPGAKSFIQNEKTLVYGIHLGDYTQCEYWGRYSFSDYYNDTKGLNVPFYHAIGNHDHDYNSGKYGDSHTQFETVLGPRYYSYNIGTQHFVMLDNVTVVSGSTASSGFDRTFSSEQIAWLRQDIAVMPAGITQIVVCTHCPILSWNGSSYVMDATSGAELFNILKGYDVICLTGHNHYDHISKGTRSGHSVIDFIHPSLAGTAWFTDMSGDGTARSAGIYRISGSTIKRSLYAFDDKTEVTHVIYNKNVNENTGTNKTSTTDPDGTQKAILVNFPNAVSCEFTESTGGSGTTSKPTVYDLNFREFYCNFNVSGKTLGEWQMPTSPGHIWRYVPVNPSATITIKATDAYGRQIMGSDGGNITTKIVN